MIIEFVYAYLLGLLSILSPCTFIIIPIMTANLHVKLNNLLCFLGGITITFGVLGILSALTGKLLTNFIGGYIYFIAGFVTLLTGLNMLGLIELNIPNLFSHLKIKNDFLIGLLYGGIALSCMGPLMAVAMVYITTKASVLYGFFIMFVFSLGFITPFVLFGLLITDRNISKRLMNYSLVIKRVGGLLLLIASAYLLFVALRGTI